MRLLVADDEQELTKAIAQYLRFKNYIVDIVDDGKQALDAVSTQDYDAIILDIMMPEVDGLEVLRKLRKSGVEIPVLLLSAKGDLEDRVTGLDMGADDYLPKPFAMKELVARVNAITRRKTVLIGDEMTFGKLSLNKELSQLEYDNKAEHLSSREFQIMEMLMRNPDVLISGEQLLAKIWGCDTDADLNIVCVYITYLRRKLKNLQTPVVIRSARGIGYKLQTI